MKYTVKGDIKIKGRVKLKDVNGNSKFFSAQEIHEWIETNWGKEYILSNGIKYSLDGIATSKYEEL